MCDNYSETRTITTPRGHKLQYRRNWNTDGGIEMLNPLTLNTYFAIKAPEPKAEDYGVFWAFSNDQFEDGYAQLVSLGFIKEGDKIVSAASAGFNGLFGTFEGIKGYLGFYGDKKKPIREKCDPQEIYFYEFNNHECQIDWDGDASAVECVAEYFGRAAAEALYRVNAQMEVDEILKRR